MTRPHSDRSQGRKPLYPGERLVAWHVRLTESQRAKAIALGGAQWLRGLIASILNNDDSLKNDDSWIIERLEEREIFRRKWKSAHKKIRTNAGKDVTGNEATDSAVTITAETTKQEQK